MTHVFSKDILKRLANLSKNMCIRRLDGEAERWASLRRMIRRSCGPEEPRVVIMEFSI